MWWVRGLPLPHYMNALHALSVTSTFMLIISSVFIITDETDALQIRSQRLSDKPRAVSWAEDSKPASYTYNQTGSGIGAIGVGRPEGGVSAAAAAAAKSLQSCPTLCDPIDGSPPGSPIPGILQAGTLEWVGISFSNAWKWKVKVKSLSPVRLFVTPWTVAYQAPPSMGFSRQEYWSGVPSPSPEGIWGSRYCEDLESQGVQPWGE